MIYFTSDQHFGHRRIIELCARPFPTVAEMDTVIIDRFNSIVTMEDIVYHLGDFAFYTPDEYLLRLNGKEHHLILGNHDYKRITKIHRFNSVQDVLYLRWEGKRFFFSHYAHRTWRNSMHGAFHLYGHSHGSMPGIGRSMDVGVDALDFYPISIQAVIERLESRSFVNQHFVEE